LKGREYTLQRGNCEQDGATNGNVRCDATQTLRRRGFLALAALPAFNF